MIQVFGNTFHSILLLILLILSSANCKDSGQDFRKELEAKNQEWLAEVAETHKALIESQKDYYSIATHSPDKDTAIRNFLREIQTAKDANSMKHLFTEEELRSILYPNVLGSGTALDSNRLDNYEELIRERRRVVFDRLKELLQGIPISKVEIEWELPRSYRVLNGHKPSKVLIHHNGKTTKLDHIKMIIEHKGQFKVAVIGS